jgi:hypothetical protein
VLRPSLLSGAIALATAAPLGVLAATDAELQEIRNQIRELRSQYEGRIQALEQRLRDAETRAAAPAPAAVPAAPPPVTGTSPSNAFNPAISAILSATYAHLPRDNDAFRRGFGLGESEVVMTANVDPHLFGNLTVSAAPEGGLEVEEAYGQWVTAPFGLVPKFGRFLSGIGYQNEQHAHAWDFVDAPLAYRSFLGGRFSNDGVQVKWVAPLEHFVELGAEAGNGESLGSERGNGAGARAFYAHTGGDVGVSHSWRAGLSRLSTRDRDLDIADFVWKYAPRGNARDSSVKLQGEYFRDRAGPRGWYLQGVWQFAPQWRAGVRGERSDAADVEGFRPRRASAMVDFNPSEFSRFRVQYSRSETLAGVRDNEWFVQYILSLGAHGAHRY